MGPLLWSSEGGVDFESAMDAAPVYGCNDTTVPLGSVDTFDFRIFGSQNI